MPEAEERIARWRSAAAERFRGREEALDELEDHLREEIECLVRAGHASNEAVGTALARLGETESLAEEFAKVPAVSSPWLPVSLTAAAAFLTGLWLVLESTPALREGGTRALLAVHRGTVTLGYLATLAVGLIATCLLLARLFREPGPEQLRTVRRATCILSGVAASLVVVGIGVGAYCPFEKRGWLWGYDPHEAAGVLIAAWELATLAACIYFGNARTAVVIGGVAGNILVAASWAGAVVVMRGASVTTWLFAAIFASAQLAVAATAFAPAGCLGNRFAATQPNNSEET